ncbi:Capsular polysaccharide biosynthesis protein [Pseudobutyrivibrio sp. OR37]|uniref:Wzz/FepE/Etk N-terminal domain-containing protein n=1 Tax=Pseudobutyrivibrio sp. OR37 TaxID=1798186 RepID=UPI0008E0F070|nr:Wzz/FepE/Etk N-terminal domain-containing protein [Pseudobutyrivibrio sp. OR37]SFI20867.1 Capsular polysaccharide biosynthesis protein [Pseudobutyrivibrio sp. OR37]
MYKNELEIDVGRCLRALVKKKKFIALFAALFFIVGIGLTLDIGQDMYTANATVYAQADGTFTDAANAVTAMNAYLDVAKSYRVCQRAALIVGRSDIAAKDVQDSVAVYTSGTKSASSTTTNFMNSSATIITFSATTADAALSMEIADAMAESYATEMESILSTDAVKTLDSAVSYEKTRDAQLEAWKNRLFVALVGAVLACLVVVACEIFDRKVRTVREATIRENIPVLGIIPDYKE